VLCVASAHSYQRISKRDIDFSEFKGEETKALLDALLAQSPTARLGSQGPPGNEDVCAHPFFSAIDVRAMRVSPAR
jgi:hypothetical protein